MGALVSNSSEKHASAERLCIRLPGPTPRQFRIPYPSRVSFHPAALQFGRAKHRAETKGYKSRDQILLCSGPLPGSPALDQIFGLRKKEDREPMSGGSPIPAHPFLPPIVAFLNREHSEAR